MKITYPGPHAFVDVVAIAARVERGASIDIDDEDLAGQLVDQGWIAETDQPAADTIPAILAWIDGDPVRAAAQLEAENARSRPRKGLVAQLAELAAHPTDKAIEATPSEED